MGAAAAGRARACATPPARQYLAPGRQPVSFTRLATRPRSQVEDVAAHLASSGLAGRPDLVYGVYRVPDLISPGRLGGEPIAEWDVVHAAAGPLPASPEPDSVFLEARDVLVARAAGEPAPLDEDLALHLLASAGIGPERTLGVARDVRFEHRGGERGERLAAGGARARRARARGRPTRPIRRAARGGCRRARPRAWSWTSCSGTRSPGRCTRSASSARRCRRRSRTSR